MLPKRISDEQRDALETFVMSDRWPIFLEILLKVTQETERDILNMSEAELSQGSTAAKLALKKGKQLGAREIAKNLQDLKAYCKRAYKLG